MAQTKWRLADAMRISHPKVVDKAVSAFILKGEVRDDAPAIIHGFAAVQAAKTQEDVVRILGEFTDLPWETVPTEFLRDREVWKALFYNGALSGQALVRNVTRLARIDAFKDLRFAADYAARLTDPQMIKRTRLHPMNYLNAVVVHAEGQKDRNAGMWYARRNKDWTTSQIILDALNAGFHESFNHVEPANKRTMIALDISGSMESLATGLDLSCAQVGAAMAMTVARTEPAYQISAFNHTLTDIPVTKSDSLSQVMRKASGWTGGGTDCSAPMTWALNNRVEIDTFVVITDNETWAGKIKPVQALDRYKSQMGIDARLAVVGVNSTEFSIADPRRTDMMDIVGGDSNLPTIISNFSAGRL